MFTDASQLRSSYSGHGHLCLLALSLCGGLSFPLLLDHDQGSQLWSSALLAEGSGLSVCFEKGSHMRMFLARRAVTG